MHTDSRGVPVSSQHRSSIDAYDRAVELMHECAGNPLAIIDEALANDPGFVLGYAFRAAFIAGAADKAYEPELRASVEGGERHLAGANERERGHLAAARAWLDGDIDRAVDLWGRVAIAYPRDTLALQAAHIGDVYVGQQTQLRCATASRRPFTPGTRTSPGTAGCWACTRSASRRRVTTRTPRPSAGARWR